MQMMASMSSKREDIISENTGDEEQMQVVMREINPFSCWVGGHLTHMRPPHAVLVYQHSSCISTPCRRTPYISKLNADSCDSDDSLVVPFASA